jgi:neutral ceramidase
MMNQKFQFGVSEIDFTPATGLPLADAAPIAKGIRTPLFAKSIVLSNNECEIAIVTLDLIGLSRRHVKEAASKIRRECGIPEENVLVVCSHTHTAPKSVAYLGPKDHWLMSFPDEILEFINENIVESIVKSVTEASCNMVCGSVGAISADLPWLTFNRRRHTRNYGVWTYWVGIPKNQAYRPEGPIDPELGLLVLRDSSHKPSALLWNFAAHNSFHFDDMYSADLAYTVQAELDNRVGKHLPCLYLPGCGANLNYYDYEVSESMWDGKRHFGLEKATEHIVSAIIATYREACTKSSVVLKGRKAEVVLAQRDYWQNWYEEDIKRKLPGWIDLTNKDLDYLREKNKPTYETDVMALRIGDVALVGLPGEVFVEFGLHIKQFSPFPQTYVCAYANDYCGYVATRRAFIGGCYEAWPNCYMKVGKEGGYFMVDKVIEILYELCQD